MTTAAGRSALVTSLLVCCGYVACWSTNEILFFVSIIGRSVDFSGWFYRNAASEMTRISAVSALDRERRHQLYLLCSAEFSWVQAWDQLTRGIGTWETVKAL